MTCMKLAQYVPSISGCLVVLLLQGCVLPSKTIHSPVYRGHVLDAKTKGPVQGARVEVEGPGLKTSARSDETGGFEVGPLKCSRLVLAVPFGEGRVPQECKHVFPDNLQFRLTASHAGYEPTTTLIPSHGTNWSTQLDVGNLLLHPK
jgi:hypothetical protein